MRSHSFNSFCFVLGFFFFFYIFYERASQSLLGPVLLKQLGWKVISVTGSEMKGRGQEHCSHCQHDGPAVQKCAWVYAGMHVCLSVDEYLQRLLICIYAEGPPRWLCVFSQLRIRIFVFVVIGNCFGKFTVTHLASLTVLAFFAFLVLFKQPAGCTVAKGSTRGFTPLGQHPAIASLSYGIFSSHNQTDEPERKNETERTHFREKEKWFLISSLLQAK